MALHFTNFPGNFSNFSVPETLIVIHMTNIFKESKSLLPFSSHVLTNEQYLGFIFIDSPFVLISRIQFQMNKLKMRPFL